MQKKSKVPVYAIAISFSVAIFLAFQFFPEWFDVSDTVRSVLKIALALDICLLIFLMDREKKKQSEDPNK